MHVIPSTFDVMFDRFGENIGICRTCNTAILIPYDYRHPYWKTYDMRTNTMKLVCKNCEMTVTEIEHNDGSISYVS